MAYPIRQQARLLSQSLRPVRHFHGLSQTLTTPLPPHIRRQRHRAPQRRTGSSAWAWYEFVRRNHRSVHMANDGFGQLPDLTVRMLETTDSHGLNDSSVRLRERDGKLWIYATAQDEPIGWLEARNSLILSSLKECGGVELECELSPSSGTSSAGQGSSKRTASPRKMRASAPVLSVTVYGPVKCAEQVGDYLTSCNEYLQVPLHAQRNTRYFNPQSLSVELDKAPLTSDLRIHSYFGECLDDLGAMDPSAQLEAIGDYEETAAPCSVKTPLFV